MHQNKVFIATSLDGYIADREEKLDWLHSFPNPNKDDMGYHAFMETVDALVMGRRTYETVLGFDVEWPYNKPVFVLSRTLTEVPQELQDKVYVVHGELKEVLNDIHQRGYPRLYIDGGKTIQSFLSEDLIDEMIITSIPLLLGGGTSLYGSIDASMNFEGKDSTVYDNGVVQTRYVRKRD